MTEHVTDDLPLLLTGEAGRSETRQAAHHLRSCPDCQQELISALVSHASLTSARRYAPELVSAAGLGTGNDDELPHRVPDLGELFQTARDEASRRPRSSRRSVALAVAAAAVVAAGASVTAVELSGSSSSKSAGRTVALQAYDVGSIPARATLDASGSLRIDARALPTLDAGHFYEVWLTNPARTRLQAVGSIGTGNRATFTVSPKVMQQYSAIEVSIQGINQISYSGTSVARGAY